MYIILGHKNVDVDSIVSGILLERYLNRHGKEARFIIPDKKIDAESLSICLSFGIDPRKYQENLPSTYNQYILVDHHVRNVTGDVVGVIDHHPTIQNYSYPYYKNEESSSTASILVKGREKEFSRDEIQLAVLATMVDTVSLHSNKTKKEDIDWVKKMCHVYQFNYNSLIKAGLCLTNISSLDDYLKHGLKEYVFYNQKIASSYVSVADITKVKEDITQTFSLVSNYMKKNDIDQFIMIVHDMNTFHSTVIYFDSNHTTISKMDFLVSRGTDIIPEIEKRCLVKSRE